LATTISKTQVVAPAEARDQIQKAIDSVFSITEERFSNFRDDSEVSKINAMPKDQVHEMSPEFTEIMREIESLIRYWGVQNGNQFVAWRALPLTSLVTARPDQQFVN
jgi:thiamine biosynthesis lipoprotein ApbE